MEPVWRQGITGSGVVVTVVDEGETEHTPLGHASHAVWSDGPLLAS